jgi:hypothetical protein
MVAAWGVRDPLPGPASARQGVSRGSLQDLPRRQVETYLASKHGQKGNVRGPSNQGAASPATRTPRSSTPPRAAAGGRGIFGFNNPKISIDAKTKTCLECHGADRHLAFWDSGKHRKNDVACNNCHSVHGHPAAGATIALNKPNPTIAPYETYGAAAPVRNVHDVPQAGPLAAAEALAPSRSSRAGSSAPIATTRTARSRTRW